MRISDHAHLSECLDGYKLFVHRDIPKVVITPACVRTWDCPAHSARELVVRLSPLYTPEYRSEPWYHPKLYVSEAGNHSVLARLQRKANRTDALRFTVAVKYGSGLFACTQPIEPSLDEVITRKWLSEVVTIGRARRITRINGLDKWSIPTPETDWSPVQGQAKSHQEALTLKKRAEARARKGKWSSEHMREYVTEELGEDFLWPDISTDEHCAA